MKPYPIGTRVILVKTYREHHMLGSVGEVVGDKLERTIHGQGQEMDWGRYGVWWTCPEQVRPLPPEDDVTAYDRKNRDVPLEVA